MTAATLLLALTGGASAAAEVVVRTDRACVVVVNFAPYPTSGGEVVVRVPDGKEGEQNVRIRNLLGEQQWAGKVDVGPGQRAVLAWASGAMTVGAAEAMPARSPPREAPPRPPAPAPAPRPAPAPIAAARPSDDPLVAAVRAAAESGGGGELAAVAEVQPPETGWPASLTLVNRTGSWANVRLDGELFEFRGELERAVPLGSGVHRVEVRDFRDAVTWWTGELWVWPDDTTALQFSQAAAPAVPGRPDAWHAEAR